MQKLKKLAKVESAEMGSPIEKMLDSIIDGKKVLKLRKDMRLYSQGAEANALYFVQSGRVKLAIASALGKEGVITLIGPGEFFGEGCLVGHFLRISTATTTEPSTIFEIQRLTMLQVLREQPDLSEKFIAALVMQNIDREKDLGSRLFDQTEKRLGRVLLKLSRYGQHDFLPDAKLSQLSDEALASLAGTTPARIAQLLTKFRKLGLVHYHHNGKIVVRAEMLADLVLYGGAAPRQETAIP